MHDDDERRFPRITLWQLLTGALRVSLTFADKVFNGTWVADLASREAERKPNSDQKKRTPPHNPERVE
jgi:hypothetical protein